MNSSDYKQENNEYDSYLIDEYIIVIIHNFSIIKTIKRIILSEETITFHFITLN